MTGRVSRAPLSAFDALAWTLAVAGSLAAAILVVGAVNPALAGSLAIGGGIEIAIFVLASLWLVRGARPLGRTLGLVPDPVGMLVLCALLGVFAHGPADLLAWLGQILFPEPEAVLRERALRLSPSGTGARVALAAVAAVFAPFVEELFFRGAMFARLSAAGTTRGAIGVTAVCFAVSHLEPRLWPALVTLGVVLGIVRARNRGIFPGFLLHAAFNATTLAVAFSEPRRLEVAAAPNPLVSSIGVGITVALLALVVRAGRARVSEPRERA